MTVDRTPGAVASIPPASCSPRCCCGSPDCAYLKHNSSALDDLEKEVRRAGELGQALLVRHEAYMVDAERDRLSMSAKIEKLETDKRKLEAENARTVEENRSLLDQLEGLNGTVTESEAHVTALEATLQSTHQELRRLEGLAARTHDLEVQLAALEMEQEVLQKTIVTTEAQEKSAIQRWRKAERHLLNLQDQLERIEREAREERERHVEVLGRMERQRAVEKELDTAAGRLKGAAAMTAGNGRSGSNVVSHFVKDILQDNANLQLGIVELREMLMNSNDEVQSLRDQLLLHQPMIDGDGNGPPTLCAELASKEDPTEEESAAKIVSQALHIHHHYHPPKEEARRLRKKRTAINTSIFTPPRTIAPRTSGRAQETTSTILSQTSVTIPTPLTPSNRWSQASGALSDFAPSSVPSSPQSMYRHSGLFDRGFDVDSRPTSPNSSIDPMSPQSAPSRHRKRGSEVSTRSFAAPVNFQPDNVIHEEDDDVDPPLDLQTPSLEDITSPSDTSNGLELHPDDLPPEELSPKDHTSDWPPTFTPTLRRSTSHESILSVSGLDIHTLKSRPSQLTITGRGLHPRTSLASPTSTLTLLTTVPTPSIITARPTLSRHGHDSSTYLRSSLSPRYTSSPTSADACSIISSTSSTSASTSNNPSTTISTATLSRKVNGWVFGRWGVSPVKSSENLRSASSPQRVVSQPDPLRAFMGRPPGINQKGPIPGFVRSMERAPFSVKPEVVDHDALREVLREGGSR